MNEIEQMYRNAEVEKISDFFDRGNSIKGERLYYPPFTAEKQLEVIKVLATNKIDKNYQYLAIDKDEINPEWYFNFCMEPNKYHAHDKDFSMALAKLINCVWQALTEDERQKIKEILK